jgi:lipid-A-disaccharide synthase
MQAHGFDSHWQMDKLTVRGYVEALGQIPEILRIRGELKRQLLAERPDASSASMRPTSTSTWNRPRATPAFRRSTSWPSIWAWRGGRIKKIAKSVDHMLCLFPFEPAILDKAGVASTYVGHPLADEIPLEPDTHGARIALGLPADGPVVAVLPGSRRSRSR